MFDASADRRSGTRAIVIGAGAGGLAAALRLKAAGLTVTLVDSHDWPGGKIRTVPSMAGPVDAGPTVLTLRRVFDDLFAATGARLEDHVRLIAEPLLARHFWPDGGQLDLTNDTDANADAIERFAGKADATAFRVFAQEAADLFRLFDQPMMQASEPKPSQLAKAALSAPRHLGKFTPTATLASLLRQRFSDDRLAQLFGRYATYVGGSPFRSPALLALIWQAEAAGIWRVEGGMHCLAQALAERFQAMGGALRLGVHVGGIQISDNRVSGVTLADGESLEAGIVVYAGDPRALATGLLGPVVTHVAKATKDMPRSFSARVWSFAASAQGNVPLAHHNVFFGHARRTEFDMLARGEIPFDPTIYVCAEDRGSDKAVPEGTERFEIILNAAPLTEAKPFPEEVETCRRTTFQTLARFGLKFDPDPPDSALATPRTFEALFPGSAGALYGQSPHGLMASLKRPRARTPVRGLYLAGGGTHPGAGVPMAALSGRHAAEAILKDRVSI